MQVVTQPRIGEAGFESRQLLPEPLFLKTILIRSGSACCAHFTDAQTESLSQSPGLEREQTQGKTAGCNTYCSRGFILYSKTPVDHEIYNGVLLCIVFKMYIFTSLRLLYILFLSGT